MYWSKILNILSQSDMGRRCLLTFGWSWRSKKLWPLAEDQSRSRRLSLSKILQNQCQKSCWVLSCTTGSPISLWFFFLMWLKMTLKFIVHMKAWHIYNHKDPPFDMKHQLMSTDPLPALKNDLSKNANFH